MPTSGRDNIIGKLKREPVTNATSDAVIGKVKYWKALFRFSVSAQTVDATPSSALIRLCFRGRTIYLAELGQNLARAVFRLI